MFFFCHIKQSYAYKLIPPANLSDIKNNAFQWIINESSEESQNLVNYLLLPLFALNLSIEPEDKEKIEKLLSERIDELLISNDMELPLQKKYAFDYTVASYVFI